MTDSHPCSTTLLAGPWRFAANGPEGLVLDPCTASTFGDAVTELVTYALQHTAGIGHRVVGKPRIVVRTHQSANADERLTAITAPDPVLPPVLGAHTWLILTVDRTCAPLEPTC